jgi:hypothetical protein
MFQISIAFPDDGAWKRFHKQLQHFPTVLHIDNLTMFLKFSKSQKHYTGASLEVTGVKMY